MGYLIYWDRKENSEEKVKAESSLKSQNGKAVIKTQKIVDT